MTATNNYKNTVGYNKRLQYPPCAVCLYAKVVSAAGQVPARPLVAVRDVRRRLLVDESHHLWILLGVREDVLVYARALLGANRKANNHHPVAGVRHRHETEIAVLAPFHHADCLHGFSETA